VIIPLSACGTPADEQSAYAEAPVGIQSEHVAAAQEYYDATHPRTRTVPEHVAAAQEYYDATHT
jgi:hypothetical protein